MVFMLGNALGFYSLWRGSPPSGVKIFATELLRLAKDPNRNIRAFVVPENHTSQRCVHFPSLSSSPHALSVAGASTADTR